MKLLTELLAQAKVAAAGEEVAGPLNEGFAEILRVMDLHLEEWKVGKGVDRKLPDALYGFLISAYSSGAADALRVAQWGVEVKDKKGKVKDRAFYSIDELLSEADTMQCAEYQVEQHERELKIVRGEGDAE
jgi:hypothetical protein